MELDPTATTTPATTPLPVPGPVPPADWFALGAFIFRNNRTANGRVRCLHGDQGDDERSHVAELAELPADEAAFWRAAGQCGEAVGVIGCEIDRPQQRAWIRGPWSIPDLSSAWLKAALLGTLERELPQITRLDAFPNEDDETLGTLYRDAGYCRMGVHRVMQAALGDAGTAIAPPASEPRGPTICGSGCLCTTRCSLAHTLPTTRSLPQSVTARGLW